MLTAAAVLACLRSSVSGGNIGRVTQSQSGIEYDIHLRHDTLSPRHRLWFHFGAYRCLWDGLGKPGSSRALLHCTGVLNCLEDQRAVFSIVNFSKARALYRDGMTVLVRSRTRPTWQRVPSRNTFYFKSSKHKAGGARPWLLGFSAVIRRMWGRVCVGHRSRPKSRAWVVSPCPSSSCPPPPEPLRAKLGLHV